MEKTTIPKSDDHHFRREDRVLRWQRISAHIAEHPADLSIALDNIDRLPRICPCWSSDPLRCWHPFRNSAILKGRWHTPSMPIPVEQMPRLLDAYRSIFQF